MALSLNLHNNSISKAYPFPHLTKQGLWLVPVCKIDEKVTFYLGHNKTKTYITTDSDSYNSVNVNGETYLPLIHLLIAKMSYYIVLLFFSYRQVAMLITKLVGEFQNHGTH